MNRVLFEYAKDFGGLKKGEVKRLDKSFALELQNRGIGYFVGDDPPTEAKPLEKKVVKVKTKK